MDLLPPSATQFSPYLLKTLSAKKRRLSPRAKARKSTDTRKGAIMKCTICSKYQQIYGVPAKNIVDLRSLWYCGLNPDPKNNTCFQKPLSTTKTCVPLSAPATITTSGPFTSVVSRCCNSSSTKPETNTKRHLHQVFTASRSAFGPAGTTRLNREDSRKRQMVVIPSSEKSDQKPRMSMNNFGQAPRKISRDFHRRQLQFENFNSGINLSVPNRSNIGNVNMSETVSRSSSSFKASNKPFSSHQIPKENVAKPPVASVNDRKDNTGSSQTKLAVELPSASVQTSTALTNVASSSQDFFKDFKAFISFIPANIPTATVEAVDTTTSGPITSSANSIPSRAIDIASVSTGTVPAASAYITVIPKSIWNTLSPEAVSQLLSQRNIKQEVNDVISEITP